ncbi:two-component system, OmpR family, sensor histidine kinase MtrB [Streptomyces sp. 2231.1]|uniref:sensor histidine kinase n=1 Tax=Streptomyces sp. 2231.1 TaxID=1855347 RepID=UPI0008997E55|nr:two-component system, OmpR family, sensor histidine kinase MtrB [Streptomyces sp. 2231.1]
MKLRLVAAFLLVAALSELITAALTFRQARESILKRTQDVAVHDLRLQVGSLAPNLPPRPNGADLRSFVQQLDRAGVSRRWSTAVTRDDGPLIGSERAVSASLREAVREGDATVYERVDRFGSPRLLIGMPVTYAAVSSKPAADSGKPSGIVVYADLSLRTERADISALVTAAWAGTIPAFAFAAVLALIAARRVLRPVRQLRTAAEKITTGALDTRLDVRGKDELAELTGTFNIMASALQRDHAELRRMEANARRFAADVSHELRTPLAAMTAVTDALDEDARSGQLPPDTAEAVLIISGETRKLARMVEDLMEISCFDAGAAARHLDDVALRTLVHKTLQQRAWREPEHVVTELPEGNVRVRVDARRIDVALANLIGNALRHGAAPVTVRARVTGAKVVIEVADRGPGIPDDVLPHVFDRFYKADAARPRSEGSGLGLAIALENVRLHHGTLIAANAPGSGAVFTVTLPVNPEAPEEFEQGDGNTQEGAP